MLIKSAAVPHFSKANGKIYYAVRVCPANVADEPYTIYRRWDDFLDFSQKCVFPFCFLAFADIVFRLSRG